MDAASWWGLVGWALLSEVIGSIAGFGAATLLTPVALLVLPEAPQAIALVACFHLFGTATRLVFFGPHIHWRTWRYFALTGTAASAVGAWITGHLPSAWLQLLFGVFLFCYVGATIWLSNRLHLPRTPGTLVGAGALSGFIAGLLGTGGAVRSAALLAFALPRDVYLGTSAALALIVDGTRVPLYAAQGLLTAAAWQVLPGLAIVAVLGASIGQWVVRRLPPRTFRGLALLLLTAMGGKLVWEAGRALF